MARHSTKNFIKILQKKKVASVFKQIRNFKPSWTPTESENTSTSRHFHSTYPAQQATSTEASSAGIVLELSPNTKSCITEWNCPGPREAGLCSDTQLASLPTHSSIAQLSLTAMAVAAAAAATIASSATHDRQLSCSIWRLLWVAGTSVSSRKRAGFWTKVCCRADTLHLNRILGWSSNLRMFSKAWVCRVSNQCFG